MKGAVRKAYAFLSAPHLHDRHGEGHHADSGACGVVAAAIVQRAASRRRPLRIYRRHIDLVQVDLRQTMQMGFRATGRGLAPLSAWCPSLWRSWRCGADKKA